MANLSPEALPKIRTAIVESSSSGQPITTILYRITIL